MKYNSHQEREIAQIQFLKKSICDCIFKEDCERYDKKLPMCSDMNMAAQTCFIFTGKIEKYKI